MTLLNYTPEQCVVNHLSFFFHSKLIIEPHPKCNDSNTVRFCDLDLFYFKVFPVSPCHMRKLLKINKNEKWFHITFFYINDWLDRDISVCLQSHQQFPAW